MPSNLFGDGDNGKSTTALGLAICVSMGWPFLGYSVIQGPVLILDWELTEARTLERVYSISRGMGLDGPPPNLHYANLLEPIDHHILDLCAWCERVQPILTMMDSFGPAAGCDPVDTEGVLHFYAEVRKLSTTPLIVDHQAKPGGTTYASKRAYGSGYKDFLVPGGMQLEVASRVPGIASILMRHTKHNFSAGNEPTAFRIRYADGLTWFELADIDDPDYADVETLPQHQKLLRCLASTALAMTREDLMAEAGITNTQVFQNCIHKLKKTGHLVKSTSASKGKNATYWLE